MHSFIIEGGKPLKGTITVSGSKNAALPILASTLLSKEDCVLTNIPRIEDIFRMIELIKSIGVEVEWTGNHEVTVNAKNIDPTKLDIKIFSRLRASILLIGPLLARFRSIEVPHPGGCQIGARPIDTHLNAFRDAGVTIESKRGHSDDSSLKKRDSYKLTVGKPRSNEIVLDSFSVTATENILMFLAMQPRTVTVHIAAAEPHVKNLSNILKKMGARIEGDGTHSITITGKKSLSGCAHRIIPDYLEAGTFLAAAAATRSRMEITPCNVGDLHLALKVATRIGIRFTIKKGREEGTDNIVVSPSPNLTATNIDARPHPGFPTDLQSPFGLLATQAKGTSLIHDTLFEGRMRYFYDLNRMGANAIIADPHRALVTGPTPLFGQEIASLDIRSGVTMIIAGLIASGKTTIKNIYQIDRGYESIEKRFAALGADIKRVDDK